MNKLPILSGTKAAYQALATKNNGVIYILTDVAGENNLFFGEIPIGKGVSGKTIKDVAFDDETHAFTFTYTDNTTKIVDLVLESVIQDISYDAETHKLTITLVSGATDEVDLTDLFQVYTGGTTDSATVSVAGGAISATVAISDTAGNALSVEAGKGLFVNISGKMNIVSGAVENNIATFAAAGQVKDSGKSIVTAISASASDNSIPTEKAVSDALVIGSF
jgi:hypothetical protein